MSEGITEIRDAVVGGRIGEVAGLVEGAIKVGIEPEHIMNEALISAMTEVGSRFERGEFFVPEMLVSAKAMESGLDILRPALESNDFQGTGTVIVGTVKGDLHDVGKNLVAMMLRGGGFDVIDLGVDVSTEDFLAAADEYHPDLIGLSALLTTTMTQMADTVEQLKKTGDYQNTKVIIGGAPVTQDFAEKIGADGFAQDAHASVSLAKKLIAI